jgi:serine/threonine protein kinase/formylglycine-generating enzyme required for sulfatase activity
MDTKRVCAECGSPMSAGAPEGLCPKCVLKAGLGTGPQNPGQATIKEQPAPPPPEAIAKYFPQLKILELLGQGGMGTVYKALQPELERFVALKILSPELSRDSAFAERFTREARALAKLNHPNIVALYDFGKAGDFYYFLMEYVDGVNLQQLEQAQKRLQPEEAFALIPKICEALQYAHEEGVVHRDIKPGNILISKKGRVKIADFGLARIAGRESRGGRLTGSRDVMGTMHYMAPEQLENPQSVDHRADIYSVGVVFYEMLTGELPIGRFASPSQKVQVDVRLDEIVLRALEKEPDRRYQHASEVKTDVETVTGKTQQAGPEPQRGPEASVKVEETPKRQSKSRIRLLALAGAASILVLGVMGVLLLRERNPASTNFFKNPANNHYYERVYTPPGITWDAAKKAAEKRGYRGLRGHLVTITSVQEQAFLLASFTDLNHYWYGGYQDVSAPDYHEPDGGWRWVTGEPFVYSCWAQDLPDDRREWRDLNLDEDALMGWTSDGQWNDMARSNANPDDIRGYIVEYERLPMSTAEPASRGRPSRGQPGQEAVHPHVAANFVWIKPGTFMMGSPDSDRDAKPAERPRHRVTLTRGFWMGRCEVTQREFQSIMGYNPSQFSGDPLRPVEQISWFQALAYCDRLTQTESAAGRLPKGYIYRLPTEAEWEYAARAGTQTHYAFGDADTGLPNFAWYSANSGRATHPVGQKLPNPWGLYDMYGNVWEECYDWFGPYRPEDAVDPEGPPAGTERVGRGGALGAPSCRSAERGTWQPTHRLLGDAGFRVVLALPLKSQLATEGPICSPPPVVKVVATAEAIASLPGKTLWLKAGVGIVAVDAGPLGGHVTRWKDQSGKGHDAVSYGSSMPLLNWKGPGDQPSVQFDGIDDMMNITGIGNLISGSTNFTVFIKCQIETKGRQKQRILSNWVAGWTGFYFGPDLGSSGPEVRWGFTDDWSWAQGSHVTMGMPIVMSFRSAATDAEIFENGTLQTRKGSPLVGNQAGGEVNSNPPWTLGQQGILPGDEHLKGHIMEIVVFDRCLTDAERTQVETCLGIPQPSPKAQPQSNAK